MKTVVKNDEENLGGFEVTDDTISDDEQDMIVCWTVFALTRQP